MATEPTAQAVTFSSPTMRARANLVRGLQAVDELERAWARRDYWTARHHARTAREFLDQARQAFEETWATTDDLEAREPAPAVREVPIVHSGKLPDVDWADPAEVMADYQHRGQ